LQRLLLLPIGLATALLNGCALTTLARSQKKKVSQEKFSCGEDCPPAMKQTRRVRD
jgi:hypothetical protein